ncbi:unnamed protein product, partial [Porites evermanni]
VDIDECTASLRFCNLNANCVNTDGSYYYSCFSGFYGDGKNCEDIDECSSGSHNCDSDERATCTNTIGSYLCSCKEGYEGDGRTCSLPTECKNYNTLPGGYGRKVTHSSGSKCDSQLSQGWYRLREDAGTKMATSCVAENRCNTDHTGWLDGDHPTVAEDSSGTLVLIRSSEEDSGDTLALTRSSEEENSDTLALTMSSEEDSSDTLALARFPEEHSIDNPTLTRFLQEDSYRYSNTDKIFRRRQGCG